MELAVAEAYKMDVGRSVARIDSDVMKKLNMEVGQIILINDKSPAVVWRLRPEDEGKGIIRIDRTLRNNAGTSLGEKVKIKKVEPKVADSVIIAPTEQIFLQGDISSYFKEKLINKPVIKGCKLSFDILGTIISFVVTNTNPKDVVLVTSETELIVSDRVVTEKEISIPSVSYEDIGGLGDAIEKIREMVELPLKHPEIFRKLGIGAPKGVLLYGPPGCGKTLLAKAVANETHANFYSINGPEILSKFYGESEENLRKIFEDAEKSAPSIIFIDEIDSIAPKREETHGELERRLVSQLLTLMDGLKGRGQVIVIAATNRPDALDPALRRPGRFDREIEIGVPDKRGRKEIFMVHTRGMPLDRSVNFDELSELTYGFTGADIEILCKEAAMKALRRILPEIKNIDKEISPDLLNKISITKEDFIKALTEVEPSGMREVYVEVPDITWNDIGGLENVKNELKEVIEWPLKHSDAFRRMGIEPPHGILLYGPPGCGKTLIAKAIANESSANFITVKGPQLLSKWVGESEKAIRDVFRRAREVAPCIIFFDELDSIVPMRGLSSDSHVTERMVSQLLTEIDGIEKLQDIVIVGATNRPDILDPALLRPGRFDKLILIPMPDEAGRRKIFEVHTKHMPLSKDVDIDELVKKTDGYTGADIAAVCREAAFFALRESIKAKNIEPKHFQQALEKIKPSVTKNQLEFYEEAIKKFEGSRKE